MENGAALKLTLIPKIDFKTNKVIRKPFMFDNVN